MRYVDLLGYSHDTFEGLEILVLLYWVDIGFFCFRLQLLSMYFIAKQMRISVRAIFVEAVNGGYLEEI